MHPSNVPAFLFNWRPRYATCLWFVPLVVACGRLGYEPQLPAPGPDDAGVDGQGESDAVTVAQDALQIPDIGIDAENQPDADAFVPPDGNADGYAPLYAARGCSELGGLVACDVHAQARDFASARAFCGELGLELAAVKNVGEHDQLVAWAKSKQLAEVMLGGSNPSGDGAWLWPDGSVFWTGGATGQAPAGGFVKWGQGEPNNANANENCLTIYVPDEVWNDVPCSLAFPGIACQ